jgi:flagellar biosynthesis component FlhA
MAALVSVLVIPIVDMLMDVLFTIVSVGVFVLIIIMATHLDSPPFHC